MSLDVLIAWMWYAAYVTFVALVAYGLAQIR